jgi:hypothetical protein
MQRTDKKNTTHLGMAFLFLSLAMTPFSLKAVGISPSLSAGIDAWRQVSSVFGDSNQPATFSELLALNNHNPGEAEGATGDNELSRPLLAQSQPVPAEVAAPRTSAVGPCSEKVSDQQKRCSKPGVSSPRAPGRAELAAVINPEVELPGQAVEAAGRRAVIIKAEAWRAVEKDLAQRGIEVGQAMKILPVKELKLLVKLKGVTIPPPPGVSKCGARPEQARELRLRASRARDENSAPSAPENCEL